MNSILFHRRNLPHYYQPDSTYFITFRVKNSLPLESLIKLNIKFKQLRMKTIADKNNIYHNYFMEYDNLLHMSSLKDYLCTRTNAQIVKNEIHKYDKKNYKLICYSIMPNHVHLIFHLLPNSKNVGKIMQNISKKDFGI